MVNILDKPIGSIGLGLMGFTWRPVPPPMEDAIAAIKVAVDNGAVFWNGGDFYGTPEYNSMTLVSAYFDKYPQDADKVVLLVKGALDNMRPDGSPEGIRRSIDNILKQLRGTKKLDVFGIARRDRTTDFATTLKVIKEEYIDTGKVGGVALSECSVETIEEAAKVLPVLGAEVELSMFTPDILHNGVADALAKHNIPVVAYSPLGRGILTGSFKVKEDFKNRGHIATYPRFGEGAWEHNQKLVQKLEELAAAKSVTPGQLALAWAVTVGKQPGRPTVIPIPGASKAAQIEENSKAVELSDDEFKSINELVEGFETAGDRYPPGFLVNV